MASKKTIGTLLQFAGRVGSAAAVSVASRQLRTQQSRGGRGGEPTCTPCAAMAKREAASAWVNANK